jgi:hypothetical protein
MTAEEFAGLGLAPGVIRGVRSFRVDKFGRLTGVVHQTVWVPGENNAECLRDANADAWMIGLTNLSHRLAQSYYGGSVQRYALGGYTSPPAASSSPALPALPPTPSMGSNFGRRGKGKSAVTTVAKPTPPAPPGTRVYAGWDAHIEPQPLQHSYADCQCGFYGYFDGSDDYHENAMVTAVVEAYGEVVIGTRGFRAKKARIVALLVKADEDGISRSTARKVSNNYQGVAMFEDFDTMVAAFPPDVSLEPSPETDEDFWTRKA